MSHLVVLESNRFSGEDEARVGRDHGIRAPVGHYHEICVATAPASVIAARAQNASSLVMMKLPPNS
jgi:hypothetical protein